MKRKSDRDQGGEGGGGPNKKQRTHATTKGEDCAICRDALDAVCLECVVNNRAVCQGFVTNAVCGHTYHVECISRWLAKRECCPLCNGTWIYPWGLSLKQLAAGKFVDDEKQMLEFATQELDPSIYGVLGRAASRNLLPKSKQRFLAQTFAHYLEVGELEALLASKKRELALAQTQNKQ